MEDLSERDAIGSQQVQGQPAVPSVRQFSARITDLVAAWEDATPDQRSLASSILSEIQVKDRTIIAARPRPGWAPYFEELLRGVAFLERETRLGLSAEPNGGTGRRLNGVSIVLAAGST